MVTPRLGVGVGLDEWWLGAAADTQVIKTGTVLVHYYPTVRAGAFVEAGLGLARAAVRLDASTRFAGRPVESIAEGSGLGLMAAVGYDLRLTRGKDVDLIVTPRVSYAYSSIGDLERYVYSPNGDRYAAGRPPFATRLATPSTRRGARGRLPGALGGSDSAARRGRTAHCGGTSA